MKRFFSALALSLILSSCGATLPQAVAIGHTAIVVTCSTAARICERLDPDCSAAACRVSHTVCTTLAPSASVQIECAR